MNKKLNTNAITNELEHSSFFPTKQVQPAPSESISQIAPPSAAPAPAPVAATTPRVVQPKPGTPKPSPQPINKSTQAIDRRYVRRTFDIFDDQLAYMTKASLEDRLAGGDGSMNSMVRQALDEFIEKRRRKLDE